MCHLASGGGGLEGSNTDGKAWETLKKGKTEVVKEGKFKNVLLAGHVKYPLGPYFATKGSPVVDLGRNRAPLALVLRMRTMTNRTDEPVPLPCTVLAVVIKKNLQVLHI